MNEGLTKTETALLEALQRERLLLQQRDWVSGIILHELSNAAQILCGSAAMLGVSAAGSPSYQKTLHKLEEGADTLGQLIAGLRELIDSTGAAPEFKDEEIARYVRGLVGDALVLDSIGVRRIGITLRGADANWHISPRLMRHALGNLLRNALRYSAPGSPISLTIGTRGRRHWIHVRNSGRKIPTDVLARLFKPGKKSDTGGMGLGLYIAQTCAERMGGRLVYGSTATATVFSIVLEDAPCPSLSVLPQSTGLAS